MFSIRNKRFGDRKHIFPQIYLTGHLCTPTHIQLTIIYPVDYLIKTYTPYKLMLGLSCGICNLYKGQVLRPQS